MAGQRQSMNVGVDGLPEVTAKLNAAIAQMGLASAAGLKAVAYEVINEAKQFAPVDTGRLRSSLGGGPDGVAPDGIQEDHDLRGPSVTVGTKVDYAAFVEFGTRHMSAQPFLRPALEVVRAKMLGEIRTVIRHAVPELH